MTYTFFHAGEGLHIIYDSISGAVIKTGELEAYICDALDPLGEELSHLPDKCPSDIRYELARFSSTEVQAAYNKIKEYFALGLIYKSGDPYRLRISGDHSASTSLIAAIESETGLTKADFELI